MASSPPRLPFTTRLNRRYRPSLRGRLEHEDLGGEIRADVVLRQKGANLAACGLLDDPHVGLAHHLLKRKPPLVDEIRPAALDQRLLQRRIDLLEEGHHEAPVDHGLHRSSTTTEMLPMVPGQRIGDLDGLAPDIIRRTSHIALLSSAPSERAGKRQRSGRKRDPGSSANTQRSGRSLTPRRQDVQDADREGGRAY